MKISTSLEKLILSTFNNRIITVNSFCNTKFHNHHDNEIWAIKKGKGTLYSNTGIFHVKKGDVIFFDPFEFHSVANDDLEEDLVFISYWKSDAVELKSYCDKYLNEVENSANFLVGTAFITPNGPLHLGHLMGVYIPALIYSRFLKNHNESYDVYLYGGTFGHTDHIEKTAISKKISTDKLMIESEKSAKYTFELLTMNYDSYIVQKELEISHIFQETTKDFISKILASNRLFEKEVSIPFSHKKNKFITDSYLKGNCPNCLSETICIECENCGLVQDEASIINPRDSESDEILLESKRIKKLYLKIDNQLSRQFIYNLYKSNLITDYIAEKLIAEFSQKGLMNEIAISSIRNNGIPILSGQVLSMSAERALRAYYNIELSSKSDDYVFFCGKDNFQASCLNIFAILSTLNSFDFKRLRFVLSEFCLLNNKKFSTSNNNAIWANEFLENNDIELFNLYTCKLFKKGVSSNFEEPDFYKYSEKIKTVFSRIFLNLEKSIESSKLSVFEAGRWSAEDIMFYNKLCNFSVTIIQNYKTINLSSVVFEMETILSCLDEYTINSVHLYNKTSLDYLRTRISLEIFALILIFYFLNPIMPQKSGIVLNALAYNKSLKMVPNLDIFSKPDFEMLKNL
jgi:methionyl-tRNA synthetase